MHNVKERRKYKKIFEERFKSQINLSEKKDEADFALDFINTIAMQYKSLDTSQKNNWNMYYIKSETARVEVKIRELESTNIGSRSIENIICTVVPITTFGIGSMLSFFSESMKVSVNNKLSQLATNDENKDKIVTIFKEFSFNMSELILITVITLTAIIFIGFSFLEFINRRDKSRKSRSITFNRLCLEALKKVENNEI